MSEYDMVDRLEKQIEGSNLALAAVAEVLQKMDSRLTKAEEEEFEMAQDQDDAVEKQEIIKAVAGEVYGLIKAGAKDTADWGMTEAKVGHMTESESDKAVPVGTHRGTKDVAVVFQAMQAMQKQLNLLKAEWGFENEHGNEEDDEEDYLNDEEEDMGEGNGENDENGEDGEEEGGKRMRNQMYSVENGQYPALEQMQKQIKQLTKLVKGKFDIQKMVQNETEGRLRKMGFREETSLTRPTMIRYEDSLGVDGSTPITKTSDSPEEMVEQMMNMSYKDLRVLQERIEQGETDGIPREFLN